MVLRPSRWVLITAISAALTMVAGPASAGTELEHPDRVNLKRGTSTDSESEAVAALQTQGDADVYVVTNELRGDVYRVVYVVRISLNERARDLTLQLDAETALSFGCALSLDLWLWREGRWSKRDIDTVTNSAAPPYTRPTVAAKRFVQNRKVLGRIRCTNSVAFGELRSDRIRLIAEP